MARAPAEGGVGEMGFRAGPSVLSNNGCWRRNTNFGPKTFFHQNPPPCVVKVISATWGSF